MPKSDTYFKIDETKPKNPHLLKLIKEHANGSVSEFARMVGVNKGVVSSALNYRSIGLEPMMKIAKYFGKDTREIFR